MNNRTGRKSVVDIKFFTEESEQRDYLIGLICTDGCISSSDYGIQITLSEKDKDVLTKISELTNVPIYKRFDKRFNCNLFSYRFRNKIIYSYLISLGITPKKTRTLSLNLPLTNHMLRGIFDGDGCITFNNCNNPIINIVSASEKFILQIRNFIEDNNIKISSIKYNNNVYNLNIYSKSEVLKFHGFIYLNATLYMERKHIKFNATSSRNT